MLNLSRDRKILPYLERSLRILHPWLILMDSDASDRSDGLTDDSLDRSDSFSVSLNYSLGKLIHTELGMVLVTMDRFEFDTAEMHCQRSLTYLRRLGLEGEEKTTPNFKVLCTYVDLRHRLFLSY